MDTAAQLRHFSELKSRYFGMGVNEKSPWNPSYIASALNKGIETARDADIRKDLEEQSVSWDENFKVYPASWKQQVRDNATTRVERVYRPSKRGVAVRETLLRMLAFDTLRACIDHQTSLTANAPALVDIDGAVLTYAGLMEQVSRMEMFLSQQCKLPYDSVVAIHARVDCHAIIAILAMASRGICFIGLDVDYPEKLITHILTTGNVDAVLIDKAHAASPLLMAQPALPLIPTDSYLQVSDGQSLLPEAAVNAIPYYIKCIHQARQGYPKGWLHLLNIIHWQNHIGLEKPTRTLQFTSLSFDISHQEICTTLCTGGTLILL